MREGDELVRTLIDLQGQRDTPILLVPQVFVLIRMRKRLLANGPDESDALFDLLTTQCCG